MTTITLPPEMETTLTEQARQRETTTEELVLEAVREKYFPPASEPAMPKPERKADPPFVSQNDFERWLLTVGRPLGVSLTDEDLRRENLYSDHD